MSKQFTPEQKEMACIYALLDAEGNVLYIGKANNPAKRLSSHMRDSRRRKTPLYSWIRKHGLPKMVVLVHNCDNWKEAEIKAISDARASGSRLLNLAIGGDEPMCPHHVRVQNGRNTAILRTSTPQKARSYQLKRDLGRYIKQGISSELKAKIRAAAITHPDFFAQWANI